MTQPISLLMISIPRSQCYQAIVRLGHEPVGVVLLEIERPARLRGRFGAVTYQGSGIGAIEAEQGDGRLDGLGGGGVGADLRSKGARGRCSPGGTEKCLSRQHRGCGTGSWMEVVKSAIDQSLGRSFNIGRQNGNNETQGLSRMLSKQSL